MVYIKNADKEASELLFIGKANKLGQWFIIHPIKESKLKTVFELENTALIDSIHIGFPYDSIAAINAEELIPGNYAVCRVFPLADSITIKKGGNIKVEKSAINTEFEYTQAGLYLLVIFGIWFHVVSAKEKESKGKFTAGAAVATILCIYIIYHYIKTIVLLS